MYELFVLGELSDGQMHGYLLHEILTHVLGPERPISWGTFYPTLKRLLAQGLIAQVPQTDKDRRRKVYAITGAGRARFGQLMARPLQTTGNVEEMFRIKLSKFHLIDSRTQEDIVRQYHAYLKGRLEGLQANRERVMRTESIAAEERPDILRTMAYDREVFRARLTWVEHQIKGGGTP
jgi:DNA-binding PadR family transcriptional regulator